MYSAELTALLLRAIQLHAALVEETRELTKKNPFEGRKDR